jgi:hypothetical protein
MLTGIGIKTTCSTRLEADWLATGVKVRNDAGLIGLTPTEAASIPEPGELDKRDKRCSSPVAAPTPASAVPTSNLQIKCPLFFHGTIL